MQLAKNSLLTLGSSFKHHRFLVFPFLNRVTLEPEGQFFFVPSGHFLFTPIDWRVATS